MQIKHVSFDFWDTLFKGNPEYRKARFKYLSEKFDKSEEELDRIIKDVKKFCDKTSEQTMSTIDTTTQIWHVLNKIVDKPSCELVSQVETYFNYLFIKNPPVPLFSDDLMEKLEDLNISTSISCNTGIISGGLIRNMMSREKFDKYFEFQVYSDEINFFKPNPLFVGEILDTCGCLAQRSDEILHIGDNLDTDGKLCELTGMKFLHVEKGNPDFNQIFNLLG